MKYGESLSSVPGTPDANSVHCLSTILSIRDSLCFTSTVLALRCCSATGRSCRLSNVAMAAPICSSADVVSLRTTQYQEIQEFVSDVLRIGVLRTWSSVGAASQVCNCFPALAALAQQAFTVQVLLWCCAAQGPQAFCCLQPRSARMSTRSWPHCMELFMAHERSVVDFAFTECSSQQGRTLDPVPAAFDDQLVGSQQELMAVPWTVHRSGTFGASEFLRGSFARRFRPWASRFVSPGSWLPGFNKVLAFSAS